MKVFSPHFLGEIYLFCKGADSSIFPRVIEGKVDQIQSRVERNAVVRRRGVGGPCASSPVRGGALRGAQLHPLQGGTAPRSLPLAFGGWRGLCCVQNDKHSMMLLERDLPPEDFSGLALCVVTSPVRFSSTFHLKRVLSLFLGHQSFVSGPLVEQDCSLPVGRPWHPCRKSCSHMCKCSL